MTRERWEQIIFAHVPDEVVQDMLNAYVLELEDQNAKLRELVRVAEAENAKLRGARDVWQENDAKLRELVRDMWMMQEALPYGAHIEIADRMRELGVEVE